MSKQDERSARRIQLAEELFKAWSSGNADAPEKFFHPDGSLYDVVAGDEKDGWPAIRAFFAQGLTPGRNLELIPERLTFFQFFLLILPYVLDLQDLE